MSASEHNQRPFVRHVVSRLQKQTQAIAEEWLDELRQRLDVSPVRIFPDATLLNHIPNLLEIIFESVADPDFGALEDRPLVVDEIEKLADLRRVQGYTLDEIVAEFHTLREVLHPIVLDAASTWQEPVPPAEALRLGQNLDWAVSIMTRVTSRVFIERMTGEREERSELLAAYGRAITHELRSRLNNAVLALDVFRQRIGDDELDEASTRILDRLDSALDSLDEAATDVFSALVSESRLTSTPGSRLPLDRVIRSTAKEIELFAHQRDVRIEVDRELPDFQVDGPKLHLILVNLLTNAVKYLDSDKSESWVRIAASPTDDIGEWRVSVEDNGKGIGESLQEVVFGRHVRGRQTHEQAGEGLGLSLVHEAVSQLGGRLWVESDAGRGATFNFTLREPDAELTVAKDEPDRAS